MKWQVERTSPVGRKLTIEVSLDAVKGEFEEAYRAVGKKAQLKGFRKGKAPKGLLKRYYGPQVEADVAEKLVQKNVDTALIESDLEPVGNFNIQPAPAREDSPFTFVATFDVMELPENPDTNGIKVEWPDDTPTPEEVTSRLEELRKMKGELVPVENEGAQMGNTVNVTMTATSEGEALAGTQASQQDLELEAGRLLPGLAEGMCGMKEGDEKDIPIEFPEDFADPSLRGKKAVFSITVHSVKTLELPELDDEFAKDLGLESLAELEERVNEEIRRSKNDEGQKAVRDSLFDQLIAKNPLEVPESLVTMRTREMMNTFFQNLQQQGISPQTLGARLPEQMEYFKEQAKRICLERALTRGILDHAKIEVSDEDLRNRVLEMMGDIPEDQQDAILEGFLSGDSRLRLKSQVEYEKILEFVAGKRPEAGKGKKASTAKKAATAAPAEKKAAAATKKAPAKKTPAKKAAEGDGAGKKTAAKKAPAKKSAAKGKADKEKA